MKTRRIARNVNMARKNSMNSCWRTSLRRRQLSCKSQHGLRRLLYTMRLVVEFFVTITKCLHLELFNMSHRPSANMKRFMLWNFKHRKWFFRSTNALDLQSVFLIKIFILLNAEADQGPELFVKSCKVKRFLANRSFQASVKSWGWEINYRALECLFELPTAHTNPFRFLVSPHERREPRGAGEEKFLWLNWTWKKEKA